MNVLCCFPALLALCAPLSAAPAGPWVGAPVVDLGRVRPGVAATGRFRLENPGPGVAHVLELRPQCGCLTARASRTRLGPGEAAEILVTFDPPPQEGPVAKGLEVFLDAPGQPPIELLLKAEVRADIGLSANQVTFQDVARDGGGLAEVRLEDRRGVAVRIAGLRTSAPAYLAAAPEPRGRDVILHLRLDGAKLPAGAAQGEDWVDVQAANPELTAFRIQVRWTAHSPN
jgi:hypothetical protein